jgi:hypothetical protein
MEFGDDILSSIPKTEIIRFANLYPVTRDEFVKWLETQPVASYDFDKDELGFYKFWHAATVTLGEYTKAVLGRVEFGDFIEGLILDFQNFVENQEGWRLLWNDNGTPKSEYTAQALFAFFIKIACHQNNIVVSKEANIGRGPVDFKLSSGLACQALVEAKLIKNSKFWNGLNKQLPKYLEAEDVDLGYFLVFAYTDNDLNRIAGIEEKAAKMSIEIGRQLRVIVVDATKSPPSASVLK